MLNIRVGLFAVCALCSITHAQAESIVSNESLSSAIYASVEGGWAWNKLNGVNVNVVDMGSLYTTQPSVGGSGIISVGVKKYICGNFAVLWEMGYGYYGKKTFNFHQNGFTSDGLDFSQINIKSTIDGFDVLAGFSYRISVLDLFFKAGAMVENARYKPSVNLSRLDIGNTYGSAYIDSNLTQVLPEIKLGIAYQLINNLSLTAAWIHTFGENTSVNLNINPDFPPGMIAVKAQNPTIDTLVLGLNYTLPT